MKSRPRRTVLQLLGLAAFAPEIDAVASGTDDVRRTTANLAAVTRYANAWKPGHLPAIRNCYHDDFTQHYFGNHPLAGDHVGKAADWRCSPMCHGERSAVWWKSSM